MNKKILSFLLGVSFLFQGFTASCANTKKKKIIHKRTPKYSSKEKISEYAIFDIAYSAVATAFIKTLAFFFVMDGIYPNFFNPKLHSSEKPKYRPRTPVYYKVNTTNNGYTRGLQNVGNTCFANASLQILYGYKRFRDHVLNLGISGNGPVHDALYKIFSYMHGNSDIWDYELKDCMKTLFRVAKLTFGKQEDSEEFIRNVLNAYYEEFPELPEQKIVTPCDCLVVQAYRNVSDFLNSPKTADFSNIPEGERGQKKYKFYDKDVYDSENKRFGYYVEKLKIFTNSQEEIFIPVGRYGSSTPIKKDGKTYSYCFRINDKISVPPTISYGGNTYILTRGIVQHGDYDGGHYIAYVKDPRDGNWFYADDSTLRTVSGDDVITDLSSNCTMLVYTNKNYSNRD